MTYPNDYDPQTDFSTEETDGVSGRSTVRTPAIDAELALISTAINAILANLKIIQRDDNALADAIVTLHTLSDGVRALMASTAFTIQGGWVTATAYALGDLVEESGAVYLCMVVHTSGTFATDLAAAYWGVITSSGTTASGTTFTPGSSIAATDVQAAIDELDSDLRPTVNINNFFLFGSI